MGNDVNINVGINNKQFKNKAKDVKKTTGSLVKDLDKISAKAGVAFAVVAGGIGLAVREAAKFESITTKFQVLTKNVDLGTEAVKRLQKFSANTPFLFQDVADAGATLLAFGTSIDDLEPRLKRIGDVAAATNKDVGELATIFGQVEGAGKLTGERLNQLVESGVNLLPNLSKELGTTQGAVRKLVSEGKVDFETFERAFNSLSDEGGVAFQALQRRSETLEGRISTLQDNIILLAGDFGDVFLPIVKQAAIGLTELIQVIRADPAFIELAANVAAFSAAAIGAIAVLAAISSGIVSLGTVLAVVGGPFTLFIAAVAGLGALVALNFEKAQEIIFAFAESVSKIFSSLGNLLTAAFSFDTSGIKESFNQLRKDLADGFDRVKDTVIEKEKEQGEARKELRNQQAEEEKEFRNEQFEALLAENEERFMIEEEQRDQFRQRARDNLQQSLLNEQTAREAVANENLKREVDSNNRRLKEQQRFGKAFADINSTINSEQVQGTKQATGELVALQNSENATLKAIGKAAAVTQIGIKTAESAMNIYAGFSTIPFVGQALGIAGAAAAVAFGAEQIGKVLAAQDGGVVTGGIPGRDSVPAMLTPGELVVPRQNFEEVVNAVTAARQTEGGETDDSFGGAAATIMVDFETEEASRIISAQDTEDSALGVTRREA